MFALAVTFQIDPTQIDAFMPIMLTNARTSLADEPGCRQFDVCVDADRPSEVFLYEVYDDEAAFKAHTETAHYAVFDAGIKDMLKDKDVRFFRTVHQ